METTEFRQWRQRPRQQALGAGRARQRGAKHRPRSSDDWDALLALGLERRRLYIASGKLVETPEGYEFDLGPGKLIAWFAEHV